MSNERDKGLGMSNERDKGLGMSNERDKGQGMSNERDKGQGMPNESYPQRELWREMPTLHVSWAHIQVFKWLPCPGCFIRLTGRMG